MVAPAPRPRTLRITGWSDHYENNRTRDIKALAWVRLPVKLDGDGYTDLLTHPSGAAHYGAWIACVLVAAKCDPRGTLMRDGGRPHDAESLSRITRIPAKIIADALDRLITIGWVEVLPPTSGLPQERQEETRGEETREPQAAAGLPQEGATMPQESAPITQDAVARQLKSRLGSGLNVCRDQVRALVNDGWSVAKVLEAVDRHAEPGLAPWDWTKRACGKASNGKPDFQAAAARIEGLFSGKEPKP